MAKRARRSTSCPTGTVCRWRWGSRPRTCTTRKPSSRSYKQSPRPAPRAARAAENRRRSTPTRHTTSPDCHQALRERGIGDRSARRGIESSTWHGPTPAGHRTDHRLARRLPPPNLAIRTPRPPLRRIPRPRSRQHLPQEPHQLRQTLNNRPTILRAQATHEAPRHGPSTLQ